MSEKQFDPVVSGVSFPEMEEQILKFWRDQGTFEKSVKLREGQPLYCFYEGPPTANGRPGVHHVQARSYKDLFPRYKTMQGFSVPRKAGWDCHGLPVEIEVEKRLGFSGKKAIEDYGVGPFNTQCRDSVMEYEHVWREMTERIGYWTDLDNAYMTMSNDFVESVWWSLKELWDKDLIYKGYKVVPYCAKDGTPLSSHEVGLGYKDVRDPSIYVRFPLREKFRNFDNAALLVWTTTPWTLPGNVAAAVHPNLDYVAVKFGEEILILAESCAKSALELKDCEPEILDRFKGTDLVNVKYTAPYDFFGVEFEAHKVVTGDFVTAGDGTGIVHIAPAFGADDLAVARQHSLPVIHSVDATGHFVEQVAFLAGKWFKDADTEVIKDLKPRKILFRRADYNHSYPHCWRCKNPLMYFATDSWFIANTRYKDRLKEKNQTIDWHPPHIKNGRYGDWLENLVDWALSRTRYWGTPLPIWECACGHKTAVGSYAELGEKSIEKIDVTAKDFDPHRPFIDTVKIRCEKCQAEMQRVPDVIDCWYDSGAMPFAQLHYPFENKELFEKSFPADFICEGLDQTRGWFNSLHQLGVMLFDNIAYKSVICHGLVLDGEGNKMSKSQGNIVNPWDVINAQGADALRWYLYASAPPEVSRRFSADLVGETGRRYLGTLWNTYYFFVLNANALLPDFAAAPAVKDRPEIDRWVLARLHRLIEDTTKLLDVYDLTPAARGIQEFVDELSNWYVRRNRRRFWNGDVSAYATLHECLLTVTKLTAPFTPFVAEAIYQNLSKLGTHAESVHLSDWPKADPSLIDEGLLHDAELVLKAVSLARSARTTSGHPTRQPLAYAMIGARTADDTASLQRFSAELQEELNVKEIRFLRQNEEFLNYQIKPNLPLLGKKLGKNMGPVRQALTSQMDPKEIARQVHGGGVVTVPLPDGSSVELTAEEVLVEALSPAGYSAQEQDGLVVALSTELTEALVLEGTARHVIRHIQELRKSSNLDISDRIQVFLEAPPEVVVQTLGAFSTVIAEETLADLLKIVPASEEPTGTQAERFSQSIQKELQKAAPLGETELKVADCRITKELPAFQLGLIRVGAHA